MHPTRPTRTKSKRQSYREISSDESELTELDSGDDNVDYLESSTSKNRANTTTTRRAKVSSSSSQARDGKRSQRSNNGKRKADNGNNEEAQAEEDAVMDTEEPNQGASRAAQSTSKLNLNRLLTSKASALVYVDIHDIINAQTWMSLSESVRQRLCQYLPPTAFQGYVETLDDSHPSILTAARSSPGLNNTEENGLSNNKPGENDTEAMDIDKDQDTSNAVDKSENPLDLAVFTDPHFESAIQTFQDHLFSGYHTHSHRLFVEKHVNAVRHGRLHVPWKDEAWEAEHANGGGGGEDGEEEDETENKAARKQKRKRPNGRGDDIRIKDLVREGILKVGDILSMNRPLLAQNMTVEKDCIIHSFTESKDVVILTYNGPDPPEGLPSSLLSIGYHPNPSTPPTASSSRAKSKNKSTDLSPSALSHSTHPLDSLPSTISSFTFPSPTALETYLLNLDARVTRSNSKMLRPAYHAWKTTSVWRWPNGWAGLANEGESGDASNEDVRKEIEAGVWGKKGGREMRGTLHYLRGDVQGNRN